MTSPSPSENKRLTTFPWGFAGHKQQGELVLKRLLNAGFFPQWIAVPPTATELEIRIFTEISKENKLSLIKTRNFSECPQYLEGLQFLFTCNYFLLKENIFRIPKLGSINLHSSLLPNYRGVHPVFWALINGEQETGVTLHQIDAGIDTGAIYLQRSIPISINENLHSLMDKVCVQSGELALDFFLYLEKEQKLPKATPQTQPHSGTEHFYARRRFPEDSRISWFVSGKKIQNLIRALPDPHPNAFCFRANGERVEMKNALELNCSDENMTTITSNKNAAGTVLKKLANNKYLIKTIDSALIVQIEKDLIPGETLS